MGKTHKSKAWRSINRLLDLLAQLGMKNAVDRVDGDKIFYFIENNHKS